MLPFSAVKEKFGNDVIISFIVSLMLLPHFGGLWHLYCKWTMESLWPHIFILHCLRSRGGGRLRGKVVWGEKKRSKKGGHLKPEGGFEAWRYLKRGQNVFSQAVCSPTFFNLMLGCTWDSFLYFFPMLDFKYPLLSLNCPILSPKSFSVQPLHKGFLYASPGWQSFLWVFL